LTPSAVPVQVCSSGRALVVASGSLPGDIIGINAVISGACQEITAEALQPVELAYIGREEFIQFIEDQGDTCLQVAEHLGRDCHSAYEVIRSIGLSHSVEWDGAGKIVADP
jgi:CRP-like cAMP-binding protein